jgi:short-subunit dehydrogenase
MNQIAVFGATSAIAEAVCRELAGPGVRFVLIARNAEKLQRCARDLELRSAQVSTHVADLATPESAAQAAETIIKSAPEVDAILLAHGTLPDQAAAQANLQVAIEAITVNFLSCVGILTPFANFFEQRGKGTIAVISSVAGDRGRGSNYVYGSAKGALSLFVEGMAHRLFKSGVRVLLIKPGMVATPMTRHLARSPMLADPRLVGREIAKGMAKRAGAVYVPRFWQLIMLIIRLIPRQVFFRTKL